MRDEALGNRNGIGIHHPVPLAGEGSTGGGLVVKLSIIVGLIVMGKVAAMARRGPVGTAEIRLIGIVLGEILLFIIAIWNVELVFGVLVLYLPFSQRFPGDYGTAVNIANILILICLFGLFLRSVKEGEHFFVKTELDGLIGLWLLLVFVSFFRASIMANRDWVLLLTLVKRFCTPIFMYYLASWIVRDREEIGNSIFIIMLATLMVAVLATKDTVTPTHFDWERREGGVVDQANLLAAFVVYYMFYFAAYLWLNRSQIKYWLLLPCLYPCARAVMVSFSRGGYVALASSLLFFSFLANKGLFIVMAIILVFIWARPDAFLPGAVAERVKGTVVEQRSLYVEETHRTLEASAQSRLDIWRGGVRMILQHPFLGVGYGQFPLLIGDYAPRKAGKDAHNGYILIAAEMGIPALVIFMAITIKLFRYAVGLYEAYRNSDRLYAGLGFGFATGLVGLWTANIFGSRFNTTETISYLWILAALIVLVRRATLPRENSKAEKEGEAATASGAPALRQSRAASAVSPGRFAPPWRSPFEQRRKR